MRAVRNCANSGGVRLLNYSWMFQESLCLSRFRIELTRLFVFLLDLRLHLLQFLLAFVWTHFQPLSQHTNTKDGKESSGHVVCVDSWDDGGGIAKQYYKVRGEK